MNKDEIAGLHPAAVEAAQIYFDHHSDNGGTFECGSKIAEHVHNALTTLSARVETLEAALQFYARESSWKSCGVYMSGQSQPCSAVIDEGDRARKALGGSNG